MPNSRERRPDQGQIIHGRRELTREAVVNEVAPGLVQEIVRAVMGSDEEPDFVEPPQTPIG